MQVIQAPRDNELGSETQRAGCKVDGIRGGQGFRAGVWVKRVGLRIGFGGLGLQSKGSRDWGSANT